MHRTSFAQMRCSLARSLELIGDWWTPLILRDLYLGVVRFDDLVEDLGISRNLLTDRLKALLAGGVIEKTAYQARPARYAYALSEAGRDLVPVILALTAWGERWARPETGTPIIFMHKACGQVIEPTIACPHCHEALTADSVTPLPGPGGADTPGTRVVARRLAEAARNR